MSVMQIEAIKKVLPHRYPFLLVDRVLELEEKRILAYKNVTVNEDFFNGHFPEKPLMPGVLQVEALAQTGCIMLTENHIENPDESLIVFTNINQAKFRKSVVPGDQLMMEVFLTNRRRNFTTMEGTARVNDKVVCELEATSAIVPKEDE
ncbi:3-hydroxyacyl-ACP dehydratase FabZ [Aliifodinibius salicampi]|uniref:3-hydroxyacyl-[acyl-carrier-protein] dehydratase FabZ n=1 Tax=Fodinibius salicampi TaxID=1920655 RepID=A0ABT3Q004_9BACT|nr:3-hydroxyacyl-ACP dehydratase FabZ [Fodinibius salicampi]MCW9713449.1 3-hydroxyacyl-ACP dehydratase FabZ [Fodinibius salicampi]